MQDIGSVIIDNVYTTTPNTQVSDLLTTAMQTRYPIAIIDEDGTFLGAVSRAAIIAEVGKGTDDANTPSPLNEVQNGNGTDKE
jgi:glycine betaine/proline transport system ATP-binding protein